MYKYKLIIILTSKLTVILTLQKIYNCFLNAFIYLMNLIIEFLKIKVYIYINKYFSLYRK